MRRADSGQPAESSEWRLTTVAADGGGEVAFEMRHGREVR